MGAFVPHKADTPQVVDPDTMLVRAVAHCLMSRGERLPPRIENFQRQGAQVQPAGLTVLRHLARLAPLSRCQIQVRPLKPNGIASPAWDGNQESGEIAPDWLSLGVHLPEPRERGQCQIVRALGRGLWPAGSENLGARIGRDVACVVTPIKKA